MDYSLGHSPLAFDQVKHIVRLAGMALTDYVADEHAEILAERYRERMIGRMIDINYNIITESGEAPSRDYYDSFLKLGVLGILAVDLARHIASCACLLNRIVHEYDEIDPAGRIRKGCRPRREASDFLRKCRTA